MEELSLLAAYLPDEELDCIFFVASFTRSVVAIGTFMVGRIMSIMHPQRLKLRIEA